MKRFVAISSVLLLSLSFALVASAQTSNLPGGGWWSGAQVQNVSDSQATVIVTAYDKGSTNTYEAQTILAAGEAYTFIPSHFSGMPSGFQGSAVVSSDQQIKAMVNVTNRASGSLGVAGGKAAAQYQGVDSSAVATALYFPLAKAGHYNKMSTFHIQNAGVAPTSPVAVFKMRNGNVYTITVPAISPNKMAVLSLFDSSEFNSDASGQPAGWSGRVGGMIVTAAQPMAGIVMEHYTTESPATILQGTRGFTSGDFDTTVYAPIIKHNRYGRFTGIQVQNVSGSGPITVTVAFKGTAGACVNQIYTDTVTSLADGTSHTFVQWEGKTNLIPNCAASATIVGTGDIVAVVNESYRSDSIPSSGQAAVMSSGIPAGSATTKASAPNFKDDRYGKRTGMKVQNIGSVDATNVVATFKCKGGATFTAVTQPQSIVAGGAILFYTPSDDAGLFTVANPFVSNNVNCGVTITSDQPIVALANESVIPGGSLEQDNNNYEAFNLTP